MRTVKKSLYISALLVVAVLMTVALACKKPSAENNENGSAANTANVNQSNINQGNVNQGNVNQGNVNQGNANTRRAISETEEFKRLTAAEHLAKAEELYNNQPSDFDLFIASRHINAIPEAAPEYAKAQSILKKIRKTADEQGEQKTADAAALQVVASSWRRDAFGAAGIWTVTFRNTSDKPVGDIKYETRYYSETGSDLGGTGGVFTSGEVQKIIPPKQTRTVKINDGFIDKEAARGAFNVTAWKFIE